MELDRLVNEGILEPVSFSKWGTPIVPIIKEDGSVRICGDFKVTINPCLEIERYPIPRIDELLNSMQGSVIFSKIDLSQAYQQILLEENSRELTTISTHKGLFKYTRLPFGITSAPAHFQKVMENGLHTTKEKIKAIQDAPIPKSVTELKSFLGLVNYYAKFVPNLSTILYPLYQLLQKNAKWVWSDQCSQAFNQVKDILISASVLVHFNPDLPLQLTCDASNYGVGAVLAHIFPNGEEKPIAFASKKLNRAEMSYSQIEKEALGIIFGVSKFNQFLYGNKFTLVTDHKPLVTIFNPSKGIPTFSANRLRRWAVILSNYDYNIKYVKSEKNIADSLSRIPIKDDTKLIDKCSVDYINFFEDELHSTHMGAAKMKEMARNYFWWPGLNSDIEKKAHNCENCRAVKDNPPKHQLHLWEWPREPWSRLHIDYFGPIYNRYFLVIVDAHSKWIEVFPTRNTTSSFTNEVLSSLFARFGIPHHITTAPYSPASNGAAENANFLFDYRNTPHATTKEKPSVLMFKRHINFRFNIMNPKIYKRSRKNYSINNNVIKGQRRQLKYNNGSRKCNFSIGQYVFVKDYRIPMKTKWVKGKIIKRIGKCVYLCNVSEVGKVWKRHANQIEECRSVESSLAPLPITDTKENTEIIEIFDSPEQVASVNNRPKRQIKAPERLANE
nr:uncharacterized protein K02A2.6-like [Onthophagus taurus]